MARDTSEAHAQDDDPTRPAIRLRTSAGSEAAEVIAHYDQISIISDAIARSTPEAIHRHVVKAAWDELLRLNESGDALLRKGDVDAIAEALAANLPEKHLLPLISRAIVGALVRSMRANDMGRQISQATRTRKYTKGPRVQKQKRQDRVEAIRSVLPSHLHRRKEMFQWLKDNHPDLVATISLKTFQNYKL